MPIGNGVVVFEQPAFKVGFAIHERCTAVANGVAGLRTIVCAFNIVNSP